MTKQLKDLIIEIDRGCISMRTEIPDGVRFVIKDYDLGDTDPNSPTIKKDENGAYEEIVLTPEDNPGIMNRIKRGGYTL
jgi:hypothetical protein